MGRFLGAFLVVGLIWTSGCSTIRGINQETKRKTVLTDVLDNDIKEIEAAFEAAKEGMAEAEIVKFGFVPTLPNVMTFEGADGAKYMFGTDQIRPMIDDPAKYKDHILELQKYKTRIFPYVILETLEEGSFLSSSTTKNKSGIEKYYIFIYYDGKLLTKKKGGAEVLKEKEWEERSLVGGIFNKILDIGGRVGKRF